MNPLYNTGIRLYGFAARLASLKSRKVKTMLRGQRVTRKITDSDIPGGGFDIWFHVASLGEFEQARPVIEKLKQTRPELKILLSFFSPSGYEVRKNYPLVDKVVYLPFDTPRNVKRFLDVMKPGMAVFVKYEFWGNFLEQLSKRSIPTYLISAIFRPEQRFFRKGGGMFRKMLYKFKRIYVQDERSRELLSDIGVTNVEIVGDTRFDRVHDIMLSGKDVDGIETFRNGAEFTIVFGSSWGADETVYSGWLKNHKNVKAIIAPHEFNHARLVAMIKTFGKDETMLYSDYQTLVSNGKREEAERKIAQAHYLIIDCFGLLSRIYRHGDIAYIGGGFGVGIHNINEAAVYGIPVIFGPRYRKFKEAKDLIELKGGFTVDSEAGFNSLIDKLLSDNILLEKSGKTAGNYIRASLGATSKIVDAFDKSL